MAKTIGRLGYLGLGLEATPGSAVAASAFIPYTEISLRGHHEPIEVQGTTTSRFMDRTSVIGKKWSEGDVAIDLDTVVAGYFFKMALGNEILTTGTPNSHEFIVTASGNTPKTATLIFGRDTDVEQYSYASLNEMTLEVSDGLATLTNSFMGNFPSVGSAQTAVVTSGTVLAFPDFYFKVGSNLTNAAAGSNTPVSDFSLTVSNNVEVIHQTGQATPVALRTKGIQVTGSYTVFFESEAEKNAYYNLNKQAFEAGFTGILNEDIRIRVPRFRMNEVEIETGVDDFFMANVDFTVEDQVGAGYSGTDLAVRMMDIRLRNAKSTVY